MIMMQWIQPMEPILRSTIPNGEDWIHQIKWDGIRGLSYIESGQHSLFTKKGNERTAFYPELQKISQLIKADSAILDGELIVLTDENKPSFEMILTRERVRSTDKINFYTKKYPVKYILFDLLALNGKDLTHVPLEKRKQLLYESVQQNESIAITDDFTDGEKLYTLMREKGWEGIVSKQVTSTYKPGKHHHEWFKTKLRRKMLVVVGGIAWKSNFPNSLLLGVMRKGQLKFIGKASTGLKQADFQNIKEYISQVSQDASPFQEILNPKEITWLKPSLTCWVEFLEWTNDGQLRHPKIIGFSPHPPEQAIGKEYIL